MNVLIFSLVIALLIASVLVLVVPFRFGTSSSERNVVRRKSGFAVSHGMVWKDGFKGIEGDRTIVEQHFK